jgi:hypothetical protein
VAENHAGPTVHGLNNAANLDIGVAIFAEFANFISVFPGAEDGESTGVVGGLGGADVEEASAIWKLNHVIDMRSNADVFV